MKRIIFLLCLLFSGTAACFAQTDTIRFTTKQGISDPRIQIEGISDTNEIKFVLEREGGTPQVYSSDKLLAIPCNRDSAYKYKLYAIQGKIHSFYARNLPWVGLNDCMDIDTLGVFYDSYADSWLNIRGSVSVKNCPNLKKIISGHSTFKVGQGIDTYLTIRDCDKLEIIEGPNISINADFKNLESLRVFNCPGVRAGDTLDLSNCTNLETVDCSTSQLGNLHLEYGTARMLFTSYFTIQNLNVQGCTNLKELDCSRQAISHLDVSGCKKLEILSCSGATGTELFYSRYTNQITGGLYACDGRLQSLNVRGCDSLKFLNCRYQPMDSLDVSNLRNLQTLAFPTGSAGPWSVGFNPRKYALRKLNVSGCINLTQLDCIAEAYNYGYDHGYADSRLEFLDASGCTKLQSILFPSEKPYLKHINVNGCISLKKLSYSFDKGAELSFLDVRNCTQLQYLSCSNNKLTHLDLSGCDSLRTLYCDKNRLSTLNAKQCASLTEIEAQNNALPLSECYLPWCSKKDFNSQYIFTDCTQDKGLDLRGEMYFNGYKTMISAKIYNGSAWVDARSGQDYTLTDSSVMFLRGGSFEICLKNDAVRNAVVYYCVSVPNKVKNPRFVPSQDTVAPGRKISIFCSTSQSNIYYTLDGSEPSEEYAYMYREPIELTESTTIKAMAVKSGWENSQVVTKTYIVKEPDNNDTLAVSPRQPQMGLRVYPNPCNGILYIETGQNNEPSGEIRAFRILDLQGREQLCAPGSVRQMDMSPLPSGIYILESIGTKGATIRHKIVRQ